MTGVGRLRGTLLLRLVLAAGLVGLVHDDQQVREVEVLGLVQLVDAVHDLGLQLVGLPGALLGQIGGRGLRAHGAARVRL